MKTIKDQKDKIENILDQASNIIIESQLFSTEKNTEIRNEALQIKRNLEGNFTIKVPLVGDFSAGKSSLINAYLNREALLPISVLPETAVSYEIYYAPVESAQLFRNGVEIKSVDIDHIATLAVQAGDIVKVFVANEKVKELEARGITLVDMPGSDSGIDAHQKAILSYIKEGTAFVTLVDIAQGTIKQSNLRFIKEIIGYNLSSSILLTKKDKKIESDQLKIKAYIEDQTKNYNTKSNFVGMVSALDNDIADFETIISSIDAPTLFYNRYYEQVLLLIGRWEELLRLEATILSQEKEQLNVKLDELKRNAQNAQDELSQATKKPELGMFAVDEICSDIDESLRNVATEVVRFQMQDDIKGAQKLIADTVRPVMIKSFRETFGKLSDQINADLSAVSDSLNSFIGTSGRTISSLEVLQTGLKSLVSTLSDPKYGSYKLITSALAILTTTVAPWVEILLVFAPDILKMLGLGTKDKLEQEREAITVFKSNSIPKIIDKLRPEIEKGIEEQRQQLIQNAQEQLANECTKIATRLAQEEESITLTTEERSQKLGDIEEVLNQLRTLVSPMVIESLV